MFDLRTLPDDATPTTQHGTPMALNAEQLGRRLRAARGPISQEAAASEIGVARSAISLIEAGQRQVTTIELSRLAMFYGRPIEWFVSANAETDGADPVQALFRHDPELAASSAQVEVGRCVHLFRDAVSLLRLLGRETVSPPPRHDLPVPRTTGIAIDQGQGIAAQERRRLGIGSAPIPDLIGLISDQGVWAATLPLPTHMSGLFLSARDFGVAVIANASQDPRRVRFSLAHEYGHALMDRDQPASTTQTNNRKDTREQRANAFAAAFLMPADGVRDMLGAMGKGHGSRREEAAPDALSNEEGILGELRSPPRSQIVTVVDAALMAEHFGVSYPAAVWRLLGVGAIGGEEKDMLLGQTTAANRYIQKVRNVTSDLGPTDAQTTADLRWRIFPLALEAWRRELITQGRLIEIGQRLDLGDADEILDLAASLGDG